MYRISKALIAALIAASFRLNALAADTPALSDIAHVASPGAISEQKSASQQRIERRKEWDSMTPEQRMERRQEMRKHWEQMSPKERELVRNKMKDHWNNMSPQEREERRLEMHEHFKNMSPEEREQFKRDMGNGDGVSQPGDDLPGDNSDSSGHPAK